ncbi:proline iminopeptidase-family hydrolase [Actinomadura xylanilytica]|uniref:proline iminopeptidase-family hydrolase n=1 Tax=Actinomadura xylanilytica TaxID=887459 RepID=UPI00255A9993|nr:proline iminopeptidase-family hydrolase [Actinomadura xylanilytica]MDL4774412.1 proline iminopeptidase-family hydrolase [Actinomadura xylanilytica]
MTGPAVVEGFAEFRGHRTWYRVTGPPASGRAPLVVLHGGPGCTHDYVLSFAELAALTGRQVIHYDQLGNGRSTHLRDRGADFWTVELFLAELDNLIVHLGVDGGYHLLGQSWGGMLGAEHAVRRPAGLRSLVIADSPASMPLWLAAAAGLRLGLPAEVEATLREHEAGGTTGSAEYATAMRVFYDRHVCRIPWPDEVARTFAAIDDDPTVYHTMNGPSEFHVVGTLRNWSIIDRLNRIAVPTLLISGRYDEATPAAVQPYADRIPDVRWQVFEESSHMPHVEEKDACLAAVAGFLGDR